MLYRKDIKVEQTKELLNNIYTPIVNKTHEIISNFIKLHGDYEVSSGFFNGHYHKNSSGLYQEDKYPIPVISVKGLCDIEIDFDNLTITSKLNKEQVEIFDWQTLIDIPFEIYGVNDYLKDYGNNTNVNDIRNVISLSFEKEFFISFMFDEDVSSEDILKFVRKIERCGFYY